MLIYDIPAASYRTYLRSFVKMIEFGIIVDNVDRLEFTDHNLNANEIRGAVLQSVSYFL
jgi:hypothetical protein